MGIIESVNQRKRCGDGSVFVQIIRAKHFIDVKPDMDELDVTTAEIKTT